MKKRLLSLALCLALCLGLFPFGALATEGEGGGVYVPPSTSTGGGGVYVETHPVTVISGETEKGYDSIIEAFNNVDDGGTIRLNNDVTLDTSLEVSGKNITLNLNGYVLGSNGSLTVKSGAALTVTNAGAENSKKPITVGLSLTLLVEKGGSFTCTDGKISSLGLLSAGEGDYNLKLSEGENHCTFGSFVQGDTNATVADLLKANPGMALHADNDGSDVRIARDTPINSLSYFSFYVGACSEHKMGADGTCDYCGAQNVAKVTIGENVAYYTDLAEAIANADGGTVTMLNNVTVTTSIVTSSDFTLDLNGKTITGESNVASIFRTFGNVVVCDNSNDKMGLVIGTSSSSGNGNFNLQDGKLTIKSGTFNSSNLTAAVYANTGELIIESGTFNGEVTSYAPTSISGGTFQYLYTNYAIADLLKDGYGFKNKTGNWLSGTQLGYLSVRDVTVDKAPISSITVTADKGTYSYGETVTLKAEMSNASSSVSYHWYKLQSNTTVNSNSSVDSIDNSSSTTCVLTDLLPNFRDFLGFYRNYVYYCTATCDGYTTGRSVRFTVTKADLSNATVEVTNPTYNGDKQSPTLKVSLGGKTLRENTDYTVVVTPQTEAGSYTLTINGMGNYTGTVTGNWNITPKTVTNPTIELSSGPFTYTGQKIEPTVTVMDEGKTIPDSEYTVSYESNINAGTAKIIITDKENGNYTVSGNTTFTIDKAAPTYTPPTANDLTYNGTAQELFKAATTQDGTTLYSMSKTSDFLPDVPLITRAGTYTFYYQVRGDSNHTDSDIGTITVTIKKAPLTITAKDKSAYVGSTAPDLSNPELNKDYTVSGLFGRDLLTKSPVLSYATEKPDMSQIGSVDINISDADAGRNYTITYVSGKLNITTRSSSSGSSNSGTKTDTVKNPDGSTTKTEIKADGSKTETTTASSAGGSTGTTVTKTDAKGNTTTEASAKLSDRDVKEAQEKGKAVTVPVKEIEAAKDANAAAKIKIDVPNNANKTTVEIPVESVTSGTVAVIVHEDGTEELVKDSKPTEHGVQLELSGSTTVKIIDNSKTFDDTKDHWSRDEVNFVAARDLFNGVGGNRFGVSEPMTRGMVNTVLARLAGVDTTPSQGQAWYEVGTDWAKKNGISDGTNPTAPVTREQLATLLYRYAGSPSVSGTLHAADAASVSDYAEDALLWANQNGIVNGVGSNTIAPKDNAQRAQVAAMLARYLQNQ